MATKVGELFMQLGIKADTLTVREFGKAIGDLPATALGAIAAIGGVEFSMLKLISSTLDATAGYKIFTDVTGRSSQQLQVYENMAKRAQVSTDAVRGAFMKLLDVQTKAKLGIAFPDAQTLRAYGALGVSPLQDPYAVFDQLSKRAKTMSRDQFRGFAQQMGVGDLIPLFLMSEKERSAAAGMGTLSDQQIQAGYEGGKKIFGATGSFWKSLQGGAANAMDFIGRNTGPLSPEDRAEYDRLRFGSKAVKGATTIQQTIHFHSTAPVDRNAAAEVGRELKRQLQDAHDKIGNQ